MTDADFYFPVTTRPGGHLRALPGQIARSWRWAMEVGRAYRTGGPAAIDATMVARLGR